MSSKRVFRVAFLVSHPIQYQAPLLKKIAQLPRIDLTVFFRSDFSVNGFNDSGFGQDIEWDIPLLDGYQYEFLPSFGANDITTRSFWRPFNYGFANRLNAGGFDVLWVHGYMGWFHWVNILSAKLHGIKVLIRDEATLKSKHRRWFVKLAKRIFFFLLRRCCDGFLAIGSMNADYYRHYGVPDNKIFLMPYAVDNDFFQKAASSAAGHREALRESIGLESGRPVILFASKMTERKRAGDLLDAYIQLSSDGKKEPEPHLLFVGDGEMRQLLEERAKDTGWNSIKFLGFKGQKELPALYDLCDVFVLPSEYEPWGLVVNEAMNAGKAVIVSDQVGCGPDLVKNGVNGHIYEARNVNALKNAIVNTLNNSESCISYGKKSLHIINTWGFDRNIEGLFSALNYK